jgi:hypothetical protein
MTMKKKVTKKTMPKSKVITVRIGPKLYEQLMRARSASGYTFSTEIQTRLYQNFNHEKLFRELEELQSTLTATIETVMRVAQWREKEQAWRHQLEQKVADVRQLIDPDINEIH